MIFCSDSRKKSIANIDSLIALQQFDVNKQIQM